MTSSTIFPSSSGQATSFKRRDVNSSACFIASRSSFARRSATFLFLLRLRLFTFLRDGTFDQLQLLSSLLGEFLSERFSLALLLRLPFSKSAFVLGLQLLGLSVWQTPRRAASFRRLPGALQSPA